VNLISSDIGRPITDFSPRVRDGRLVADARQVLSTLTPARQEVHSEDGREYLREIMPYRTGEGQAEGVVVTYTNVTERRAAEHEQAHLAAIVESSEDAIISKDLKGVIQTWNEAAEEMFGYTAAEAVGRSITLIVPEDRRQVEVEILERIGRGESIEHFETERVTKGGKRLPVSLTISPVRGPSGDVIGASKIARDISDRRAADLHQGMLVAELDHRVKNTLAVVLSLASEMLAQSGSLEEFGPAFEGRIRAMGKAHTILSRTRWRGGSLRELVAQVTAPVCGERCSIHGEDVLLPPNVATGMAMVVQELATNAAKYGALREAGGQVRVSWRLTERGPKTGLEWSWEESGGPPVRPPLKQGFGCQLIRMEVEQDMQGKVDIEFRPGGLRCTVSVNWKSQEDVSERGESGRR
jgi:two-component system CheB/CheR fusion protein